jgi:ribonuclease HI/exonuclease III
MKASINIATLNMNGLNAPSSGMDYKGKWSMINQTLNKHKIAILALQETHLDEEALDNIRNCFGRKMQIFHSEDPHAPRTTAGVAFVINKSLIRPREVTARELSPGRALYLKVKWLETETTTLINIYAPNNRTIHPTFWKDIDTKRTTKRLAKPEFVLGDFNVTEDPIDRCPARPDDIHATDALRDTRFAWEIQDAWRLAHPSERQYTYRAEAAGHQIKSRLDRIYTTRRISPMIFDWEITPSAVPTDHWMVRVKYAPADAPTIGKGRWTLPTHMLKNKKVLKALAARGMRLQADLERLRHEQQDRETMNPQRLWQSFKDDIRMIAKRMAKETHHKINSRVNKLEQDIKSIASNPNLDTDDNLKTNEAFLANELAHLEKKLAKQRKDNLAAELTAHGEKLGGIWSAINKEKKPRDLIRRLKNPNIEQVIYERDSQRMANLARDYHETLQSADLRHLDDFEERIDTLGDKIPENQTLEDPDSTHMNKRITTAQVEMALHLAKNGSATGLDGCPYELWKALQSHQEHAKKANKPSFDIVQALTTLMNDIQNFGVDERTDFALGWMCPIYKKKDPTDISNYRPITLLNTDYKLLTKVLAIQLMDNIEKLIHSDQAGFIPRRSIFNHIRLAKAIITYAEITEEDGAIVALDQEKAYDRIRHDYLWRILEKFKLPQQFINTIKSLYRGAQTRVAINGMLSSPFNITRGIRQGDPLSCILFDLGIEPLACTIRKDNNLKGITIPGLNSPIKITLFADDTNLFLSKEDRFDDAQNLLEEWCKVSGAKFNIDKTEIIPIGTPDHRQTIIDTRKINQRDNAPLAARIRIARDGDAVRVLGAWIGNRTNDVTPWEPILEKIKKNLDRWGRSHPTMRGRKIIIHAIVGGHTQFLTKAQGMPSHIEDALTRMIRNFMWGDDSSPRLTLDFLQTPPISGGLNLLDIQARNEAIEIIWLKAYLNMSPTRPTWARITDLIIDASAPHEIKKEARINSFLQAWDAPQSGPRRAYMNNDTIRMLEAARKHKTNLAAIRIAPHLRHQLPAWHHIASAPCSMNNEESRCLLSRHEVRTVADLIRISARIRTPNATLNAPHTPEQYCICRECIYNRLEGCRNPHRCASEALKRLQKISPRLNPLSPSNRHGGLSLTKRRKAMNRTAKKNGEAIIFDPSITSKEDLAECFRTFTNPDRIANVSAKRLLTQPTNLRHQEVEVYTDGSCINNGKANAACGSGIWFGPNDDRNRAMRIPGEVQSNQVGELAAVIVAAEQTPASWPLKIYTDSKYVIEGLTTHLSTWEDQGWIGIQNAQLFKRAAYLLKRRSAPTSFQWVKGHEGNQGNEESDRLAREGVNKQEPDELNLKVPIEYDIQGAKLKALTQALAYRGIQESKGSQERQTTENNLDNIREAIERYNGAAETNESLWRNTRNPAIRIKIQQFLFKSIHSTQKIGPFWSKTRRYQHRQLCRTCNTIETMEHILLNCNEIAVRTIWELAKNHWPHEDIPPPELSIGIILGCGSVKAPRAAQNQGPNRSKGPTRLLQILVSESAHLIWVLRCERVIQKRRANEAEIKARWTNAINRRLTDDKINATRIKRDKRTERKVKSTWEAILARSQDLPDQWLHNREVLVGRRAGPPIRGP